MMQRSDRPKIDQHLQKAFHFALEDLAYNHNSNLSPSQRQRLYTHGLLRAINWAVSLMGVYGLALVGALVLFGDAFMYILVGGGMITLLLLFLIVRHVGLNWWRLQSDLAPHNVRSVEGAITLLHDNGFFLQINHQDFVLTRSQFNVLQAQKHYRVFYTPNYRLILAIEEPDLQ